MPQKVVGGRTQEVAKIAALHHAAALDAVGPPNDRHTVPSSDRDLRTVAEIGHELVKLTGETGRP